MWIDAALDVFGSLLRMHVSFVVINKSLFVLDVGFVFKFHRLLIMMLLSLTVSKKIIFMAICMIV